MDKTYIDTAPQEVIERAFGPHTEADLFPDPRLQQLLGEFEEALGRCPQLGFKPCDVEQVARHFMGSRVRQVARRYIIARDFQVFDEKWEVLWKLTYGGSQ